MFLLVSLNLIALATSIMWAYFDTDFEPIITSLVLTATLTALWIGKSPFEEVKEFVRSVIFRKEILSDLPLHHKHEAILALIQPSSEELEFYPDIETYYRNYIGKFTSLGDGGFATNYEVNIMLSKNEVKDGFSLEIMTAYILHRTKHGFGQYHYASNQNGVVTISTDEGERKVSDFIQTNDKSSPAKITLDLDDEYSSVSTVNISECVKTDWSIFDNFIYKFSRPVNKFIIKLRIPKSLSLHSVTPFFDGEPTIMSNEKDLVIHYSDWINTGEGIAISLAPTHQKN